MNATREICVVTGSRAEFGLLRPVMIAIREHGGLALRSIACGSHLLEPEMTVCEVAAEFEVEAQIVMQPPQERGRSADADAVGRGIMALADHWKERRPDVVLVLGDRIEAFAAAAAASISGIRVAHMHGGDRAEGIADEAMRHAISKLAHLHFPATPRSAHRLIAMGEESARVTIVGSPAIDGLDELPPLDDAAFSELGSPRIVMLLHPAGDEPAREREQAGRLLEICKAAGPTLVMNPNHDPGREAIVEAVEASGLRRAAHLPRPRFIGLLKRAAVIVGNSSAGLIECAALGLRCVNVGTRQAGRERFANVSDVPSWDFTLIEQALRKALVEARTRPHLKVEHEYGDGRTGARVAQALAAFDPGVCRIRKLNSY